jgi:hypothetical protein
VGGGTGTGGTGGTGGSGTGGTGSGTGTGSGGTGGNAQVDPETGLPLNTGGGAGTGTGQQLAVLGAVPVSLAQPANGQNWLLAGFTTVDIIAAIALPGLLGAWLRRRRKAAG